MYWLLLITITAVVTLLIVASFGWRVFVNAKGLIREVKKASVVIGEASALMESAQEMDGFKAMRARTSQE
jgi:hypothetical protein